VDQLVVVEPVLLVQLEVPLVASVVPNEVDVEVSNIES
jgi:hypothetical protein